MKQLAVVVGLCVFGLLAWLLGSRLSSDALGMAVGLLFGILAGIPTALLVLASHRDRRPYDVDDYKAQFCDPTLDRLYPCQPQVTVNNYYDNRQLTVNTGAQGMPLISDRQREIAAQRAVGEVEG